MGVRLTWIWDLLMRCAHEKELLRLPRCEHHEASMGHAAQG